MFRSNKNLLIIPAINRGLFISQASIESKFFNDGDIKAQLNKVIYASIRTKAESFGQVQKHICDLEIS